MLRTYLWADREIRCVFVFPFPRTCTDNILMEMRKEERELKKKKSLVENRQHSPTMLNHHLVAARSVEEVKGSRHVKTKDILNTLRQNVLKLLTREKSIYIYNSLFFVTIRAWCRGILVQVLFNGPSLELFGTMSVLLAAPPPPFGFSSPA